MRKKIPLYKTMSQYLNNINDICCIELEDLENDLSTGEKVKVVVLYIETAYDIAEQLPLNLACDGKTFATIRNINPDFEYKRRMERRSIFLARFKF